MLVLSSSARRMRTLSVYNSSRQGMSKNSQHFSPTTSKSCFIVVLPFLIKFFCKGCLTLVARSLCKHWVGASAAMLEEIMSWEFLDWFPLTAHRLLHRNQGRFEFSRVCACNTWAGINMRMFHFDVTLKQINISSESTLCFERQKRYTLCTFRFQTLQDVFIH